MTSTRWLLALVVALTTMGCVDDSGGDAGEGEGEAGEGEGEGEGEAGEGEGEQQLTCVITVTPEGPHGVGSTVTLSSSSSSSLPGRTIVHVQWRIVEYPHRDPVTIDTDASAPTFVGDVAGPYTFELTVTDDTGFETRCQTVVVFE